MADRGLFGRRVPRLGDFRSLQQRRCYNAVSNQAKCKWGIGFTQGAEHSITNNEIYENGNNGIDFGDSDGYTVADSNVVHDNGWRLWPGEGHGILILNSSNNKARFNTVYNTNGQQRWGLTVYQGAPSDGVTDNNELLANRVYGHSDAGIQLGLTGSVTHGPTSNTVVHHNELFNNAFSSGDQIGMVEALSGFVFHNKITRPGNCHPSSYYHVSIFDNDCRLEAQAEAFSSMQGVCVDAGAVGCLDSGDWIRYGALDFGNLGSRRIVFRIGVDNCCAGRRMEIRLGGPAGTLIGTLVPQATGGWWNFQDQEASITHTFGTQNVYIVIQGGFGAGNIDKLTPSSLPVAAGNGYGDIEAESYDSMNGVCVANGAVGCLDSGDWVKYSGLSFGSAGADSLNVRIGVDPCCAGKQVQVRLGSQGGTLIGTLYPTSTGSWTNFVDQKIAVSNITGTHDIFLVFQGGFGIGNIDRFNFIPSN